MFQTASGCMDSNHFSVGMRTRSSRSSRLISSSALMLAEPGRGSWPFDMHEYTHGCGSWRKSDLSKMDNLSLCSAHPRDANWWDEAGSKIGRLGADRFRTRRMHREERTEDGRTGDPPAPVTDLPSDCPSHMRRRQSGGLVCRQDGASAR